MTGFDRKIKKLSKEFKVPDGYHQRVDEVLESIREGKEPSPVRKYSIRLAGALLFLCCFLAGCLFFFNTGEVEAGFFGTFKQTILDFLGIGNETTLTTDISSHKETAQSKLDLMIELQETVADSQNLYLMIKIIAPAHVEFNENITFDYYGFCRGANYNTADLLPGAKGCRLLEVLEGKKNIATYVVDISTDTRLEEGTEVTAFFKDLMLDPYGDSPQMLVEGMWSIPFTVSYTVSDIIELDGTEDMAYSFLNTTAAISKLTLTPLGMTVDSDVSHVPPEELGILDTNISIRLKMIDGSEKTVMSHDTEESTIMTDGSGFIYEKEGRTYLQHTCQFKETVDTNQVIGIYIEDYYVPLKNYE